MTETMTIVTEYGEYQISTDPDRLDREAIREFLARTYWAAQRPVEVIERSLDASLVFGLYDAAGRQVGLARVVTDAATFAWVCDVFVAEEHRGRGLGKALVGAVMADSRLTSLRMMLGTADAHDLYAQFGFESLSAPERIMMRPPAPAPAPSPAPVRAAP